MKVMLVAFKPDGTRVDFRVRGERCVIGRDTDADLRIPVGTVSRQHCEVRIDGDEPVVRDLGSSNGTFLNGKRVTESSIDAGDLLRVGPTTFTVVVDGIPDVVTPPSDEGAEPEGSSMMDIPAPKASPSVAAAAKGGKASRDDDAPAKAKAAPAPAPAPVPAAAPGGIDADEDEERGGGFEDPLSKMIERQDDDDDFDFDFFDDDEDEDDDDMR